MPSPLFPFDPDWSEPVRERRIYLTNILPAYDGTEQRVRLRKAPRLLISYRLVSMQTRETAALHALLWGNSKFTVPLWQDAQPLVADAAGGSGSISVTTTGRRFAAGGLAAIWRDPFTHEIVTIASVSSGALTLDGATTLGWTADGRTIVMPARAGVLELAAAIGIASPTATQSPFSFLCEAA